MKLLVALSLSIFLAACAGIRTAGQCQADLGVAWAPLACQSALEDPGNQSLVIALGNQACARAQLGMSDPETAKLACDEARAKAQKAAWVQIERAASTGGGTPRLELDELLPELPAFPPTQAAQAAPLPAVSAPAVAPATLPTTQAIGWTSPIVPAGRWVIVRVDGWVLADERTVQGFPSLEACQEVRAEGARHFLHAAADSIDSGDESDYRSWQDFNQAGCAKSDGSARFMVHNPQ